MTPGSFDDLAEAYARGRPHYAAEAIDWAAAQLALSGELSVADLGAGTGILTRVLVERFVRVWAIDPSAPMLEHLPPSPRLTTCVGTAEETSLPARSVDALFSGQALHWFDPVASLREWRRISRGPVSVIALWNDRRADGHAGVISRLLDAAAGPEQAKIGHRGDARARHLERFAEAGLPCLAEATFPSPSLLSLENATAFLGSISYLPAHQDEVFKRLEHDVQQALAKTGPLRFWDTHVFVLRAPSPQAHLS